MQDAFSSQTRHEGGRGSFSSLHQNHHSRPFSQSFSQRHAERETREGEEEEACKSREEEMRERGGTFLCRHCLLREMFTPKSSLLFFSQSLGNAGVACSFSMKETGKTEHKRERLMSSTHYEKERQSLPLLLPIACPGEEEAQETENEAPESAFFFNVHHYRLLLFTRLRVRQVCEPGLSQIQAWNPAKPAIQTSTIKSKRGTAKMHTVMKVRERKIYTGRW